jgi:hypothetical protein
MTSTSAHVPIPTPARYAAGAKHFEHRVAVERSPETATICFPEALCTLSATEADLEIHIQSESTELLSRYEQVVSKLLKLVASAEEFDVQWTREDSAA